MTVGVGQKVTEAAYRLRPGMKALTGVVRKVSGSDVIVETVGSLMLTFKQGDLVPLSLADQVGRAAY